VIQTTAENVEISAEKIKYAAMASVPIGVVFPHVWKGNCVAMALVHVGMCWRMKQIAEDATLHVQSILFLTFNVAMANAYL
jgi:hypothetical protein